MKRVKSKLLVVVNFTTFIIGLGFMLGEAELFFKKGITLDYFTKGSICKKAKFRSGTSRNLAF